MDNPVTVTLRDVAESDLTDFLLSHQDSAAHHMAAFTADDPSHGSAFHVHWRRIIADPYIVMPSILRDQAGVGHVGTFGQFGGRELTYGIVHEHWNQRVATAALSQFLRRIPTRPLRARAATDHIASRPALDQWRFAIMGQDSGFANARKAKTEEFIFTLR